jgi:putative nucleotidyltransferase with HDIG domain
MSALERKAPRLVARAMIASALTVAVILITVFVLISVDVRRRVRESVTNNLEAVHQLFADVESRRELEMIATVSTLAESPTLKAALDTWQIERRAGSALVAEAVSTVKNEANKIARRIGSDVLVILDARGTVVASAGPRAAAFPAGAPMQAVDESDGEGTIVVTGAGPFRMTEVPLEVMGAIIGTLALGAALDDAYARQLSRLARAHSAIVINDRVWATTLPLDAAATLPDLRSISNRSSAVIDIGGESWAVRHVNSAGPAEFFALASIDAAAADATSAAFTALGLIAFVSVAVGGLGSWWLARTLTRPIDQLSATATAMTTTGHFTPLPAMGTSRELDALTNTLNALMRSLAAAEAETHAAYLGAIHALAAALDARDPYTAGHSERVSALAVEMGRMMNLGDVALDRLRLGALLHDIGKIGIPDEILGKKTALTPEEYELIRSHPVIGARILRSVPFLAPHLPIVELHHERPDGHGYPYGLTGDAIPLTAHIVHVADAYDAMTSARAYRPARSPQEAIAELQRCTGTDFDQTSVDALIVSLPRLGPLPAASAGLDRAAFQWPATTPHLS